MRRDRTWIIIADGEHVVAIETTAGDHELHRVEDMCFSTQLPPTHELVSDRAGRTFESRGKARHAKEGRTDPHRELKRAFARRIAVALQSKLQETRFDHLVLVASPVTLGDLRTSCSSAVRGRVRAELPQDLVKMPPARLLKHLRARLTMPVPAPRRAPAGHSRAAKEKTAARR